MNERKMIKIAMLSLLLAVSTGLSACRLGRGATPTPIPITLPGRVNPNIAATNLETYTVQRGEVVEEEILTGRVIPAREEDLFFRRSGQVTEVYVEDGDLVQKGDIIAVLDNEILELDLEAALIGLAIAKENLTQAQEALVYRRQQAELNLTIAQTYLDSSLSTVSVEVTSSEEPEALRVRRLQAELAQLNLDNIDETIDPTYELNVKRAELAVERVKQTILEGQIEVPYDGEIRFINLPENGEQLAVQGYAGVARLVDTSQIKIELNLPRTQLETLSEGMPVAVSAASLGSRSLDGVIDALPRPFGTSQGSLTEVTLVNPADNSLLREGITVAVAARLKSKPNALVIPRTALREENQIYHVMVQKGETVRQVNVAVGVLSSDLVEIVAGLEEGENVVVGPVQGVASR